MRWLSLKNASRSESDRNIMMLSLKMKDAAAAAIITDNVSYFKAISAIRHKVPLSALRLFKLLNASVALCLPKRMSVQLSLSLFLALKIQADLLA